MFISDFSDCQKFGRSTFERLLIKEGLKFKTSAIPKFFSFKFQPLSRAVTLFKGICLLKYPLKKFSPETCVLFKISKVEN